MTMEYVSLPGETRPPVPDGPKSCSGDEMRILHNTFLWAYERAPGLVRGTGMSVSRAQWLRRLEALLAIAAGLLSAGIALAGGIRTSA